MALYLGVDAGGSKTLAVITTEDGTVKGVGLSGSGNFQQENGQKKAKEQIQLSIDLAIQKAGIEPFSIKGSFFGMAGADRPKDFAIVKDLLTDISPSSLFGFENDVYLGLVASHLEGVGVGVVCGSGTNVLAFNHEGKRIQIGGMGYLLGDQAGGKFITTLAIHHAMRGYEGRGKPTILYELLCRAYGLKELVDLVDYLYQGQDLKLAEKTPLLFLAAQRGDEVALEILRKMATELGISALAAIRELFSSQDPVPVVAMGGVFQRAPSSLFYQTFQRTIKEAHPRAEVTLLPCEPVFGAIYSALILSGEKVKPSFQERLKATFPGRKKGGG